MAVQDLVTATLNYSIPPHDGSKAWVSIFQVNPKTGQPERNYTQEPKEVQIENVRGKEEDYSLDKTGFQFFTIPTSVKDFNDEASITTTYYEESIDVIKKLTGANRVVVFDHTIRRNDPSLLGDTPTTRKPVHVAHVDQTPRASTARVHRHLPAELAPELVKKRYQIINLWRPFDHAAIDHPLAVADWRSLDTTGLVRQPGNEDKELLGDEKQGDFIPTTLRYPDRDGETLGVSYNPNHRWKYLRGMTPDEGILIKCADSIDDGSVARLTPHTAFADPSTPTDAPARHSIELRALVFYD